MKNGATTQPQWVLRDMISQPPPPMFMEPFMKMEHLIGGSL